MSRRKQKEKRINIKLIVASIIAIIFIICIIYNIIALFLNPTDTFMIENGEISSTEQATGYIIREEKLFQGENYKNGIYQIKTEGERVAKGDHIFRYYTNNEEELVKKIADLDLQIQDALEQNQNNLYSSDIVAIDSKIEENLKQASKINNVEKIAECNRTISNLLTKKAKLTGELSPSGSYIKELISKRSEYEKKLNSGSEYIDATVSGVVSYRVDGLEDTLNSEKIKELTEQTLKSLNLKTGQTIPTSNECGKIVNNYYCYIATIVDSEEAKTAEIGDNIKLLLPTGDEIRSKIYHISEEENGKRLLIFKIEKCVEKLINYRKISFEIIWWSANGLKVPNSSIIEKDEMKYIVRKRIGYIDNILVKVLKVAENYSIIENYTTSELKELGYSTEEIKNMKSITLYDEIILSP